MLVRLFIVGILLLNRIAIGYYINNLNLTNLENEINEEMCSDQFENRFVFCEGKLIEAVQYHHVFECSKEFVDSSLRQDPQIVLQKFYKKFPMSVNEISKHELTEFIDANFDPPGSEMVDCELKDFSLLPWNLLKIQDFKLLDWSLELNKIWQKLCQRISPKVKEHPDRYSLLWLPHHFIIPGGLYREIYYWDTYWICKGLIASEMIDTAKGMVQNLASLVEKFGFVPNGNRVYYTKRSQPPLLTLMVHDVYESSNDLEFLRELLPTLIKELEFWDKERKFDVELGGDKHQVYFYRVKTNSPRPESLNVDKQRSSSMNGVGKKHFYRSVASSAESGWDFSSRWMRDGQFIQSMDTQRIAPVDLNAFQCMNLRLLAYLHEIVGDVETAQKFKDKYKKFKSTFTKVFYDQEKGTWFDFDQVKSKRIEEDYGSAAVPLFAECYDDEEVPMKFYERFKAAGFFNFSGGVPATLNTHATQQWDFPLAWSPLNHMLIEGFRKTNNPFLQEKAFELAQKWISNNFKSYNQTKLMFEKYNVYGSVPHEFDVQFGFGWSNGVVLDLLSTYYDKLRAPDLY